MSRRVNIAEPILRTSEENHRVFATCDALSAAPIENCKAEAETPANNVATFVARTAALIVRLIVERYGCRRF